MQEYKLKFIKISKHNIMSEIIQGGDLMLFVEGKSIAFATSHKLNISAETTSTSHKDVSGGWTTETVKKLSWTANTENLYCDAGAGKTFSDLFDLMIAKTSINVIFAGNAGKEGEVPEDGWTPVPNTGYKGQVIITSLECNAPDGDNATFTAEFKGVGKLEKVPAL